MDISNIIRQLEDGFTALKEYFEETIDSPIYSDCAWALTEGEGEVRFAYSTEDINKWDDLDYSCEIIGRPIKKGEYTAIYGDNGCGDQYWMIFKNSNRRDDLREE